MKAASTLGTVILVSAMSFPGPLFCQDSTYGVRHFSPATPYSLVDVGGTLFFFVGSFSESEKLWKSDGTEVGTVLVKDPRPGPASLQPAAANFNGTLLFSIRNQLLNGRELWRSDGTDPGTSVLKFFYLGRVNVSQGITFLRIGQTSFFNGQDSVHGQELWKTDGTETGTILVRDIFPGASNSFPGNFTNLNGTLYFSASSDNGLNWGPWRSDGTEQGTFMVCPGAGPLVSYYLTEAGGKLFFSAADSAHGIELWKSDGTANGTVIVKDINPGQRNGLSNVLDRYEKPFASANGILYFPANDGVHGFELWKSDGTETGTVMVKDISPGPASSMDSSFAWKPFYAEVNGVLFFLADDGIHGYELWSTNGTDAGTFLVRDIYPASSWPCHSGWTCPQPRYLTNVDGVLFFSADDSVHGQTLWKSDGTESGTILTANVPSPTELTKVNHKVYFFSGDALWATIPGVTGVGRELNVPVSSPSLKQNYPNPFNPSTTLRYALPHASIVTLTVYNTLGQQVAQLVNEQQQAGYHDVVFRGDGLASGVYFYQLRAGSYVSSKKLLMLR